MHKNKPIDTITPSTSYLSATGEIRYTLTNDYMFRAILQSNENVLKGLICSLLHMAPEEILEITIENPIELGKDADSKEFILDIRIRLNDNTITNLEMQVVKQLFWPERSLSYAARLLDQLKKGNPYGKVLPVIHIGILDFQPFDNHPEFYATYKLLNTKDYHLYSDKLTINVLDLTHTELATEEDKTYRIDHWAKLFKATTWEEIKMIAENNAQMKEATQALYKYNADSLMRERCEAREEYHRREQAFIQAAFDLEKQKEEAERLAAESERLAAESKRLVAENESLASENESLASENESLASENESLASENESLASENAKLVAENAKQAALIKQLLAEKTSKNQS